MKEVDAKTAVIVGAGLSGICMAISLKKLGIDFVVLEKTNELGGTWSQNIYPGCGCDTPMFAYCYSFEMFQGGAWPKQPEILEYFKHCANKYEINEHIRYNTSVAQATYQEKNGNWQVTLADGNTISTKFIINATGQLNIPYTPKIEGIEKFENRVVHSAEYCSTFDTKNKVVGVLGNGATTLQIVESLQPEVKDLYVFARSPKYVYPRVKYSPITIEKMKREPEFWHQVRQQFIDAQDQYRLLLDDHPQFDPFDNDSQVKQFYSQSNASDFADFDQFYEWLDKHDLRPNYPTGCSRPLVSNTFHDAIRESNVKIVANSISRLSKTSVVADDQEYSVDLLIMATGFSLNNLIPPYDIKGKNGNHLSESWKSAPETYLGMVTTDFPNLFFLYGPNTNTNSTAVTFYVESQVNYIEQVMREYLRQPFSSIEIKPDVLQNYSLWLEEKNKSVSETSDCSSYYQNDRNINISTFPGCYREYEKLTKDFAV
ncbi:MAG: NAD(P)/FAD-dependent oxidoreductase, partial [Kangiellaceae bacterium]|nr:NAD(P)/FAD-dependent oxidoreductase [Kangiellaceae bacterium]